VSTRRLLALVAAALCLAALAYGLFVRRVEVYGSGPDHGGVVARLGGGALVRSAVRREIVRDPVDGRIVRGEAPGVECPT
jgi:hypothetical protein